MTLVCCLSLLAAAQGSTAPPPEGARAEQPVLSSPDAVSPPSEEGTDATEQLLELPSGEAAEQEEGKLELGGGIRARIDIRPFDVDDAGQRRTSAHFSFDTLLLTADYDSSVVFGAAQYRFYGSSFLYSTAAGYEGDPWDVHFPVYAYVGAKISDTDRVTVGIQPVPFDDRYWGSSWYDSLGFVFGLEEVYNAGISYSHADDSISVDAGFFPVAGPPGFGMSEDSARFTVNIVKADPYVPSGSRNAERNMLIGRVQYRLEETGGTDVTLSGSAWLSSIHNFDTGRDGRRRAFALSVKGERGPWHAKLLAARQEIDAENAGRSDVITVGDYDFSYNIAAKGNILFAEIGRSIETGNLPFDLNVYTSYARFLKDAAGFDDTQRINIGAFWTNKQEGNIRVWSEILIGRNDPYIGAGQFLTGAAQGGDDKWKASALIMMGYYF